MEACTTALKDLHTVIPELIRRTKKAECAMERWDNLREQLNQMQLKSPPSRPSKPAYPSKPTFFRPKESGSEIIGAIVKWFFILCALEVFHGLLMFVNPTKFKVLIVCEIIALIIVLIVKSVHLNQKKTVWQKACETIDQQYPEQIKAWESYCERCKQDNQTLTQRREAMKKRIDEAEEEVKRAYGLCSEYNKPLGIYIRIIPSDENDSRYYSTSFSAEALELIYSTYIQTGYATTWQDGVQLFMQENKVPLEWETEEDIRQIRVLNELYGSSHPQYLERGIDIFSWYCARPKNTKIEFDAHGALIRHEPSREKMQREKEEYITNESNRKAEEEAERARARAEEAQKKQQEELERIRKDLDNIDLYKTLEYIENLKKNS